MRAIILGFGEIGQAIHKKFERHHYMQISDMAKDMHVSDVDDIDVLLVCYPYSDDFVEITKSYIDVFNPKATIIFSTVAIGTTEQIPNAVHCPVEGKHPDLSESMDNWRWYMGGKNTVAGLFFKEAYVWCTELPSSKHTEFLKLRSTSLYGVNIEFARYTANVCDALGLDYNFVKEYDESYNQLYKRLNKREYQRYILNPPIGNIGGHCVVPNAEILDKQFPSDFLKEIYRDKKGDYNGSH